jgi:membrane protease YdiL (CAAX protease family)
MKETPSESFIPPVRFFSLTFILSWLVWIPLMLSHLGIGPFHIPEEISGIVRLLGVLMPAVSAMILTARSGGTRGLRNLWKRLLLWRVNWRWWLAAVLGQPVLLVLTAILFNAFSGSVKIAAGKLTLVELLINAVFLLIATLGEEIGWRGAALPGLQARYSPLKSSLILGVACAVWHLPFWLLLDTFDQFGILYLLLNFVFVLPLTFYVTWFFNRSHQSILLPVMFHLTFNLVNTALLPVTMDITAFALLIVFECAAALFILPQLGRKSYEQAQIQLQA